MVSTNQSSMYPPFLNALEAFAVIELHYVPSAFDDVNAANNIKEVYNMTKISWQGDPCVPTSYAWDGLKCSYNVTPRIISMNLSSSGLKGIIANSFFNLSNLEFFSFDHPHFGSRRENVKQGYKQFQAEVQLIMVVHHRNLVSLLGYCNQSEHLALVYEFMPNGNLRQHLSERSANVLSLRQRIQITVEAAQGLDYLHNGCRPSIIHRDLKTTNILLNEQMQAKISDFGLSRAFSNENESFILTQSKRW